MNSSVLIILFSLIPFVIGISICPTREVVMSSGRITSPGYSSTSKYPSDTDCTLTIKQPLDTNFTFTFTKMDIEGDEDGDELSCYDSLTISGKTSKDFCGATTPSPFTPGLNVVTLQMISDGSVEETGFDLSFTAVKTSGLPPAVNVCPTREIIPNQVGRVHSPGFASNYGANLDCKLTLKVPSNKEVEVTFNYRDIEYASQCTKDKLSAGDEGGSASTCGPSAADAPPKKFSKGDVDIHFTTDGSGSGKGFMLTYKLIDLPIPTCSCPNGNSFIKRTIDKNNIIKRADDDISLEFKTNNADALFLYAKGGDRDFLLLKIQNGNIVFECDLGTGNMTVTVPTGDLNDNAWHKVVVRRRSRNVNVFVDGFSQVSAPTKGSFSMLDIKPKNGIDAAMYVLGGPSDIRYSTKFKGCVRNFVVDEMKPIEAYLQNDPQYNLYGSTSMGQC